MTALPSAFACHASRPVAEGSRPSALDREVDDRRRAAERRGPGAGLERVLRERAAERQLHVGVDVDRARDHVLAGRVDRLVGGRRPRRAARPRLPICAIVSPSTRTSATVRAVGRDDGAVGDQGPHRPPRAAGYAGRAAAGRPLRGGNRSEAERRRGPVDAGSGAGAGVERQARASPRGSAAWIPIIAATPSWIDQANALASDGGDRGGERGRAHEPAAATRATGGGSVRPPTRDHDG